MKSKTTKCLEILELLLQHGGDLFEPDNGGVTPLDLLQLSDASLYQTVVKDFCSKYPSNLMIILLVHVMCRFQY